MRVNPPNEPPVLVLIGTGDTKHSVLACADDQLLLPLPTSARFHPQNLIITLCPRAKLLWYTVHVMTLQCSHWC